MHMKEQMEVVFDYVLNEEMDRASSLLHNILVERARAIYEEIVSEEEIDDVDATGELAADIEVDQDNIDNEEAGEEELVSLENSEDEVEGEEEVEDRVEDLEAALAELQAKFDALLAQEMEEPQHAELADEMGELEADQEEIDAERMMEATVFHTERKASVTSTPAAQSLLTKAPKKEYEGKGEPVENKDGSMTSKKPSVDVMSDEDNVDVKPAAAKKPVMKDAANKSAGSTISGKK